MLLVLATAPATTGQVISSSAPSSQYANVQFTDKTRFQQRGGGLIMRPSRSKMSDNRVFALIFLKCDGVCCVWHWCNNDNEPDPIVILYCNTVRSKWLTAMAVYSRHFGCMTKKLPWSVHDFWTLTVSVVIVLVLATRVYSKHLWWLPKTVVKLVKMWEIKLAYYCVILCIFV